MLIVFSRLIQIDDSLNVKPEVLKSWTYDVGSKTYEFSIRDDVRFHNGQILSSEDIIFSFHQWAKANALDSDLLTSIEGVTEYQTDSSPVISGIKKLGPLSFSVKLRYWDHSFLPSLAVPRFVVYPNRFAGKSELEYFAKPIGSGPYVIQTSSRVESSFDAHREYFAGAPKTPHLVVKELPEDQAVARFHDRTIDNLVLYDISKFSKGNDDSIRIDTVPSSRVLVIILSRAHPLLRKLEVRSFFTSFVKPKKVVKACYSGAKEIQHILPEGVLGSHIGGF
jgi:ABC-type transport system substrate-binding protein